MTPCERQLQFLSRRQLFQTAGYGIGAAALTQLLQQEAQGADKRRAAVDPLAPKKPHFKPRAKNVIYIHMVGAPSHLDLFDYKPRLVKHDGEKCPDEMFKGKRLAFIRNHPTLLGTRFKFNKCGESGLMLSELLPHLQTVADEMCLLHSLQTNQFNHAPAQLFMHTGFDRFGRPPIGSWVNYGLGSMNRNLPGYVVLVTGSVAGAGNALWGSGFLPSVHQGTEFRSKGDPVLFLSNPKGMSAADRKRMVNSVRFMNEQQLANVGDPEIATRIAQYEMAYRMQTSVPELMDTSKEPAHVHEMYGTKPGSSGFANNCLLARRLVERGVRFVQLFDQGWDHHGNVFGSVPNKAKQVDRPIAALIKDLKQRGMLNDTLIVWAAEFGRTPMAQGDRAKVGRDHHKEGFTLWLAGGGTKGGHAYGQTDDLGYGVAKDPMHMHDFNATLLHLLGMDHEKLTFKFQGRDFRLTDVHGHVVRDVVV